MKKRVSVHKLCLELCLSLVNYSELCPHQAGNRFWKHEAMT